MYPFFLGLGLLLPNCAYRVKLRPGMVTLERAAETLAGRYLASCALVDFVLLRAADFDGRQAQPVQPSRYQLQ